MKHLPGQKRILIWSASYAPQVGGLQTIVESLAIGLQKKGHILQILTNKIPSSLPSQETINDIRIYRQRFFHPFRPINSFREFLLALFGVLIFPARLIQLAILIHRFKPDVVNIHFPSQQIWFLGILQKYFKKVKFIISLHGDEIMQFFESDLITEHISIKKSLPISDRIKLKVLKRRIKRSHGLTACSGYLLNLTSSLFNPAYKQGQVVYNGIDYSTFSIRLPRVVIPNYIFACGRLVHSKGFDMLLRAYALLPDEVRSKYILVIAGSGVEKGNLISLAIKLKIQNRVQFYGISTKNETAALFQHCVLAVVPSRKETFGIILLEAIASGARVVSTNIGGIPEIAHYGKVTLCKPNFESIGEKLKTLLAHEDHTPGLNDSKLNQYFSNEIMIEKYEELLTS